MNRKLILMLIGCVVLVAIALVLFLRPKRKKEESKPRGTTSAGSQEERKWDRAGVTEEYRIVDGEKVVPPLGKATSVYRYVYKDEDLWVYGHAYAPPDLPRLELRFMKPDKSGKLKPCKLLGLPMYSWREEGRNLGYRTPQEITGLSFDQQGVSITGAERVRVLLTNDKTIEKFHGLYMGCMYYLGFQQLGYESRNKTPDKWGACLLKVPENVPPGKVAVMELDVTQQFDPWKVEMKTVKLDLKGDVPAQAFGEISTPGGRPWAFQIGPDGRGEKAVRKLGGELKISVGSDVKNHLLYYKRRVESKKITFPADADVVVDPDSVVEFKLRIPQEKVPFEAVVLGLLLRQESWLYAGYVESGHLESWNRSHPGKLPPRVTLYAAPGTYYLGYNTDYMVPPTVIGKITVKKSDAGKTLEVEPLEE